MNVKTIILTQHRLQVIILYLSPSGHGLMKLRQVGKLKQYHQLQTLQLQSRRTWWKSLDISCPGAPDGNYIHKKTLIMYDIM